MPSGMSLDEIRTAGLLFGEELALGLVEPGALAVPAVIRTVRAQSVPSALSRRLQVRQLASGGLSGAEHSTAPRMAARRAVLGDAALGRPKLLLRVDAFPHLDAYDGTTPHGPEQAAAFHAILHGHGIPYLMAVAPRVAQNPLDAAGDTWRAHSTAELDLLAELRRDGVTFGVHGLDRRTRTANPRHPNELPRTKPKLLDERIDAALQDMRDAALHADVFVPPYDRLHRTSWPPLASRFDVVTGGPASVEGMGFHSSPTWRAGAVWLPAYAPLHGTAAQLLPAVRALAEQQTSLWLPVALQWDRELEADGGAALRELCAVLAAGELARSWDDFLLAVGASRQLPASFT